MEEVLQLAPSRALLRVIDVPEFNAKQELRTMLTDPATYPVFESNDDAALLAISGTYPEEAPLTVHRISLLMFRFQSSLLIC